MIIWTDGSGNGRYCYLREDGESRVVIHPGPLTAPVAEYKAILLALADAKKVGIMRVDIYSDSQVAVNQLNHRYRITEDHLRKLAQQAWRIASNMVVYFHWIHGKENPAGKLLG